MCLCTWRPHSITSRTKTHHTMTDTTAVTIWIPLWLFYNFKKTQGSYFEPQYYDHLERGYLKNTHLKNWTSWVATDCIVLISESTTRLRHSPTHQRSHLQPPTVVCINLYKSNRWNKQHHTTQWLLFEVTLRSIKIRFS